MRTARIGIALALGLGLSGAGAAPADAQSICTEPVSPTCVDVETTYETERTLKRCRRDLEDYSKAVDKYVQCLRQKADNKESEARDLRERLERKSEQGSEG